MQEVGISLNRLFVFLLLIKVNNTAYSITYCKRPICFSMWISQIDIGQMVRIRDTERCWRCCPFEINILWLNYNVKGTWSILHLKGCLSTSLTQFDWATYFSKKVKFYGLPHETCGMVSASFTFSFVIVTYGEYDKITTASYQLLTKRARGTNSRLNMYLNKSDLSYTLCSISFP